MKKLILILILLLLAIPLVSAARYVEYNAFEGFIEQNTNITTTDTELEDFQVIAFKCQDKTCSELSDVLWIDQPLDSDNNSVTVRYPTNKRKSWLGITYPVKPKNGYAVYFYKEGYIPWEEHSFFFGDRRGENINNPYGPINIYLTKKQRAFAPIENLEITNTQYPNMPVMINIETNIDAETYAALRHSGPLEAVPQELEHFYNIETKITLQVSNNQTGQIVETQEITLDIPASESRAVGFEWTPSQTGLFDITVSTDVIDEKVDQETKITKYTSKTIEIIPEIEEMQDKCYTILNNLEISDPFPTEEVELEVYATKISNYMDNQAELTPVGTQVTLEIFNQDQNLIYTEIQYLEANENTYFAEPFEFELDEYQAGEYTIQLTGIANDTLCQNKENMQDIIALGLTITQTPGDNLPPRITSSPITQAKENKPYTYQVTAQDPENDQLTYSLEQSPQGMTIDSQTGLIQYTPDKTGKYKVEIKVSDGQNQVFQRYNLYVSIQYTKKHLFTISSELNALNSTARSGKYFTNHILLRNIGQQPEKYIKVKASIPEIGFSQQVTKDLTLGPHDNKWVPLTFKVPNNTKSGTYLFVVEIYNNNYKTQKYGTIEITGFKNRYLVV